MLARSVYLSFGDLDADVSDNYFDLLPNEPLEIIVKTHAPIDAVRQKLGILSLVDAPGVAASAPLSAAAQ